MDNNEFLRQQYITLRDEIKATKQRSFLIVLLGLIAVIAMKDDRIHSTIDGKQSHQ